MKITVSQPDLNNALKTVSPAIARNGTMEILKFVKMTASKNKLTLETTDLNIGIDTTIEAEVLTEGSVCVPCKLFQKYINKVAKTKPVEIELIKGGLKVECGASKSIFNKMEGNEFPQTPDLKDEIIEFDQSTLKNMLEKTSFCASDDETKPFLCGVLLKVENGKLTSVATDTYKLSAVEGDVNFDKEIDIILPTITTNVLTKQLQSGVGKFMTNGDLIKFKIGNTFITSRIIHGDFPDYKMVIPKDTTIEIKLNSADLKATLDRILSVSQEDIILIDAKDNELIVSNTIDNKARSQEVIECEIEGELDTAFNGKFLLEFLKHVEGDVSINGTGKLRPLRVDVKNNDNFKYVIMPIKRR